MVSAGSRWPLNDTAFFDGQSKCASYRLKRQLLQLHACHQSCPRTQRIMWVEAGWVGYFLLIASTRQVLAVIEHLPTSTAPLHGAARCFKGRLLATVTTLAAQLSHALNHEPVDRTRHKQGKHCSWHHDEDLVTQSA